MNTFLKKVGVGSQKGFASLFVILAIAIASAVVGYTAFEKQRKVEVVIPIVTESQSPIAKEYKDDSVFMSAVNQSLGASGTEIPTSVALFETSLASSITNSATSMTLVSATDKAGTTLASSTYAFIIDEGTASEEMVLADCTSTACTNMIRGLSPLTGTTTVSTLKFQHRRGASVKITDGPQLLILSRMANGNGSFPNIIKYGSNPTFTTGTAGETQIITKKYADDLAIAGAPDMSATTKGIGEKATGAQAAAGSADGSGDTTAPLVLTSSIATSTCQTTGNYVLVASSTTGKLGGNCLDGSYSYTFSGTNTFSGTTTMATTSITSLSVGGTTIVEKFGGNGSDGALNITSGTTTINLANAAVVTKNYSSISITGTGALAFSNPASTGSTVILKSQGAVTITSSAAQAIDMSGVGAAAGTAATDAIYDTTVHVGNAPGTPTAGTAGAVIDAQTIKWFYTNTADKLIRRQMFLIPGGGGRTGATSTDGPGEAGGAGGRGGGALYIEVAGAWNFTGAIDISGQAGTAGGNGTAKSGGGGGAGGSVGQLLVLYNTLTASSGAVTAAGGAGGNGGNSTNSGNGWQGGGGGGSTGSLVAGVAGGAGGSGVNDATGNGAAGTAGGAGTGGGGGGGAGSSGAHSGGAGGAAGTAQTSAYLITQNYIF